MFEKFWASINDITHLNPSTHLNPKFQYIFWKMPVKIVGIWDAQLLFDSCCPIEPNFESRIQEKSLVARSGKYNAINQFEPQFVNFMAIFNFFLFYKNWHLLAQMTIKQLLSIQNSYNFHKYLLKHVWL